jgi:hypothetical protein
MMENIAETEEIRRYVIMINPDSLKKRDYFFINEERPDLSNFIVNTQHEMFVKDRDGEMMRLVFRVTRNAQLGPYQHWIYGQVLEPYSGYYEQVEFRFYKDHPEYDSIEIFPQAPPIYL